MGKRRPSLFYTMIIALAGVISGLYAIQAEVSTQPVELALTILAVTVFFIGWAAIRMFFTLRSGRNERQAPKR